MTLGDALLQSILSTLDLCRLCKSRNLHHSNDSNEYSYDLECTDSVVSKLRVVSSDLQNVAVERSELSNVTMTDCRFSNVRFEDCKLEDVHFYNVDLHDVTFRGLDFGKVRWVEETLDHAFVTQTSFGQPCEEVGKAGFEIRLPILCSTQLSRTRGGFNWREGCREVVKEQLLAREELRRIVLGSRPEASLLKFPQPVLDQVVTQLFHQDVVRIMDFPKSLRRHYRQPAGQTHYNLSDDKGRITYIGWKSPFDAAQFEGGRGQAPKLDLPVAFLRVSRKCYGMGVAKLYDRRFAFTGSTEAALSFLHDHRKQEHTIKKITLPIKAGINADAWRRLFNLLVHERTDLEHVVINLRADFWSHAPWKIANQRPVSLLFAALNGAATTVVGWMGWSAGDTIVDRSKRRSLLQHVARLASPRVTVNITFNGLIDRAAQRFALSLKQEINRLREERPDLTQGRLGSCTEKRLERCCAWEKDLCG